MAEPTKPRQATRSTTAARSGTEPKATGTAPAEVAPTATRPKAAKAAPAKKAAPVKVAKPKATAPAKPPKLIEKAGDGYRSPDGRFTVEGTPGAWYVADGERPSPLGTPTIAGPFRTLAEVKDAVREAAGEA